jgi:phosphoserine phosphatase
MTSPQSLRKVPTNELIDVIKAQSPDDAAWVFDCDGTLITGDISVQMAWGLLKSGLAHPDRLPEEWDDFKDKPFDFPSFMKLHKRVADRMGYSGVYEWEALLQAGLPPSYLFQIARTVLDESIKLGYVEFTKPVSEIAKWRASIAQDTTWIVSGSAQVCVAAIGDRLGIPRHRVLGTQLETVDDIYAPRIAPPGVVWEELKRLVLDENGVSRPWFVAGDTIGDWHMFDMATNWCWCVIWGPHRHRGEEFRRIVQERLLSNDIQLPEEPGTYTVHTQGKNWVLEVKGEPT